MPQFNNLETTDFGEEGRDCGLLRHGGSHHGTCQGIKERWNWRATTLNCGCAFQIVLLEIENVFKKFRLLPNERLQQLTAIYWKSTLNFPSASKASFRCKWNKIRSSMRSRAARVTTNVWCLSILYTLRPFQRKEIDVFLANRNTFWYAKLVVYHRQASSCNVHRDPWQQLCSKAWCRNCEKVKINANLYLKACKTLFDTYSSTNKTAGPHPRSSTNFSIYAGSSVGRSTITSG